MKPPEFCSLMLCVHCGLLVFMYVHLVLSDKIVAMWMQRIKYGVVRMKDLAMDVLTWDRFYLSGRLQKPVCMSSY
jgi:hypothetical protein